MYDFTRSADRMSTAASSQWLVAAVFVASLVPATAGAQSVNDGGGAEQLEEVIVTATRREENLMEVPISITALTGEELDRLGAIDLTYLSQQSPNTTLEVSRGTNTTLTAFMRGVGQQDPVAGFESGVGMYLDDVYLNRPQAAVLD
ncbi:MAG: TonB-dependent receptor plug domain-containing protein, partial [Xanthomonadales bacterium]|nr:TonB-dependent receptor plug domain-containing protein [Xanthomonadales bacterium]